MELTGRCNFFRWYHLDQLSFSQAWHISGVDNQWDKDVALKLAMGLDTGVFKRGRDLLLSSQ